MRKIILSAILSMALLTTRSEVKAQFKVAVFDIDLMVQAMPGYHLVDSLMQIYDNDSLGTQYQIYQSEYDRLDSTYKSDSALVAQGKKLKAILDYTAGERRKIALNLVYWQQISQNKSNTKRSEYAQPLYEVVAGAYKKVLLKKKYTIILKPQTYEMGFPIDNLFIAVAKELKLTTLPQELIYAGDDPDAVKTPVTKQPVVPKPKN